MPNTVSNVLAGRPLVTGGIWSAPLATASPTDAAVALNAAFMSAGYIGDDGLQETIGRDTTTIKAWGGDTVKIVQTDFNVTYQFTFIEPLSTQVNQEVYGAGNVTVTAKTPTAGTRLAVAVNASALPHLKRVFEVRDGLAKVRIVLPDSQIISVGDVTYSDSSVVGYQVTVQAFADANGNSGYKFSDDGITG